MADFPLPDAQIQGVVDVIVERVTQQVTERIGQLVEHLVERQSEEFRERIDRLEDELELYKALSNRPRNAPVAGDLPPRPAVIDLACVADPAGGSREVTFPLYGRIVHRTITPGSDPAEVWRNACEDMASYYMGAVR